MINGKREACLSPLDRGFSYGDGVFRTFPVKNNVPVNWDRHYTRLRDDCNALRIVCPLASVLLNDIEHLCQGLDACAVKIIVTRGESGRGYAVPPLAQPSRVVIRSPMPDYPVGNSHHGVALHLCETRLGLQPALAGIKHLNRLENVLARMEWLDPALAEGLMLDAAGYVIEGTMSNVFMRLGSRVLTPDLSECGVAGVTRQRILELLPTLGYTVAIEKIPLDVVYTADEVVICNSLLGVWQVRYLTGHRWPEGGLATTLRANLELDHAIVA